MSEDAFARVEAALVEHQVLVLRDQPIEPRDQAALARRFGEIEIHPAYPATAQCEEVRILEHTAEHPSKIEQWHSDMTFRPRPPMGTLLHGMVIPKIGGDTLFASMTAAFEGLSDRMQHFIDGLHAEHSFEHGFSESLTEPGGREQLAQALRDNPPVVHPVVRRHPVDGRRAIYVNELFTTRIVELRAAESRAVLELLWRHAVSPEYTFRVRWAPQTVVLWDNRSTQHRPVNDHGRAHRMLHRVTIAGDEPR